MRVVRFFLKTLMVLVAAYAGVIAMGVTVVQLIRHDRKLLRYFKSYNKWIIKIAGKPGVPYALLQHVGRNSGKSYQTPLGAAPLDGVPQRTHDEPAVDIAFDEIVLGPLVDGLQRQRLVAVPRHDHHRRGGCTRAHRAERFEPIAVGQRQIQ